MRGSHTYMWTRLVDLCLYIVVVYCGGIGVHGEVIQCVGGHFAEEVQAK